MDPHREMVEANIKRNMGGRRSWLAAELLTLYPERGRNSWQERAAGWHSAWAPRDISRDELRFLLLRAVRSAHARSELAALREPCEL